MFFFGSLSVLVMRSAIQTEKYFYFSDPRSAELVVSGWLHDFSGMKNYPVILVVMIGHMTFCGALDDFPTIYVSMTLIDVAFFFFFFCLARMITRSQSFVAEHPQHGLSRCQSPVFKGDIIHCCRFRGWHSMTRLSEIQACFWRPDIAV